MLKDGPGPGPGLGPGEAGEGAGAEGEGAEGEDGKEDGKGVLAGEAAAPCGDVVPPVLANEDG